MSIADILHALADTHPADMLNIRRYLAWIKIRRRINHRFFFQAHWICKNKTPGLLSQAPKPLLVSRPRRAHWL